MQQGVAYLLCCGRVTPMQIAVDGGRRQWRLQSDTYTPHRHKFVSGMWPWITPVQRRRPQRRNWVPGRRSRRISRALWASRPLGRYLSCARSRFSNFSLKRPPSDSWLLRWHFIRPWILIRAIPRRPGSQCHLSRRPTSKICHTHNRLANPCARSLTFLINDGHMPICRDGPICIANNAYYL